MKRHDTIQNLIVTNHPKAPRTQPLKRSAAHSSVLDAAAIWEADVQEALRAAQVRPAGSRNIKVHIFSQYHK